MSIKNIGVDIEKVGRFRKLPYSGNRSFYAKIFTAKEIAYCLSKSDPYPHFTARFAAKEAVSKAINQSVYKARSIEITSNKDGVPKVKAKIKGEITLSLSHTKDQAIAFAVWSR